MKRQAYRSKKGQGYIALLLMAVTIGYLYKTGLLKEWIKPTPLPVIQIGGKEQTLPDMAAANTFKATAQQVRAAVSQFQQNRYNQLPRDLAELHRETGLDLMKDPWGGQYYVQQGFLRCTGNQQVYEKVW